MGLALSVTNAVSATEPGSTLELTVSGMRSARGNVLICLTAKPRAFPDCSKDGTARKLIIPAAQAKQIAFADLAPGTYALSLIHDENSNGKLDTRLIIPREGFGFSRNPMITFGPPSFSAAAFKIAPGLNSQSVKVKYML